MERRASPLYRCTTDLSGHFTFFLDYFFKYGMKLIYLREFSRNINLCVLYYVDNDKPKFLSRRVLIDLYATTRRTTRRNNYQDVKKRKYRSNHNNNIMTITKKKTEKGTYNNAILHNIITNI